MQKEHTALMYKSAKEQLIEAIIFRVKENEVEIRLNLQVY